MCTCPPDNYSTEEYHTALSECVTPEERRTSTRYYEEEFAPPYYSTPISPQIPSQILPQIPSQISPQIVSTPRRIRSSYQPYMPRTRVSHRGLTTGVAIVPRRIDFDAVSDIAEIDDEETARERLQQLQSPASYSPLISETGAPGTYRRTRATQYPLERRQYVPRMVQITPCGKCLRGK